MEITNRDDLDKEILLTEIYSSEEDESRKAEVECPSCGNSVTVRDYQQSKIICESCERVLKEEIKDRGPEWRAFDQEGIEEKRRAGPPATGTIHDKRPFRANSIPRFVPGSLESFILCS